MKCLAAVLLVPTFSTAQAETCRPVFDLTPTSLNVCADAERVRIALVGDVLLHSPLQRQGYTRGFDTIWASVTPFLRSADVAYANFEGASAAGFALNGPVRNDPGPVYDGRVYSTYPLFNYHPSVIDALVDAGFDVVSTANNHALDRLGAGADATLDALQARGLATTGTVRRGDRRKFLALTPTRLGTIAWLACTYSTNGVPDPGQQVLMCFSQTDEVLGELQRAASIPDVVGTIVVPHWGVEYAPRAHPSQTGLGRRLAQMGAMAVVGTHPHTVQPWNIVKSPTGAQVPVIHSTGNFVSGQPSLTRQTGMLAWMELCRAPADQDMGQSLSRPHHLVVANAGWVPLRMGRTAKGRVLETVGSDGVGPYLKPAHALIESRVPGFDLGARLDCGPEQGKPFISALVLQ